MLVKLVLFKDVWGEQFYRHFRVFKSVHGRAKVEFLISILMNLASFVLMTLFPNSLEVVRSTGLVVSSPG